MSEYTFASTRLPIHDLQFISEDDNKVYRFAPREDITNIELARILHLFIFVISAREYATDWRAFIEQNNLWRHFEEKA